MRKQITLILLVLCLPFFQCSAPPPPEVLPKYKNKVDSIAVSKSKKRMSLYAKHKLVKTYKISVGSSPIGHKQYQGDNKTPEGKYYITDRNPNSSYYLNLHISYPNNKDRANAKRLGKPPGGDIKIHGYSDQYGKTDQMNLKFGYTWGCIAVTNNDMKEIYQLVKTGAVISIRP